MSLTSEIREFALDLGYSKVGIVPYDGFPEYERELASRGEKYEWFGDAVRSALARNNPRKPDSFAKSVIVLVWDFSKTKYPERLVGKVGRAYLGRGYLPPEHRINGVRIALFRSYLREKGLDCETDVCLPDRWIGALSGVTSFGKNTLAYADGIGSFIILKTVAVDKELDYDEIQPLTSKCPENCRLCLDACPTQALYEPFKLDPLRCIAANTFGRRTADGRIPIEIREKMGCIIHGCDICQQVCPRNQPRLKQDFPRDPFLEILAEDFTLTKLLHISDEFYQARVEPIMYNYIRELWLFQRNATVAIGNSGDRSYVPDLIMELDHPEPGMRSHVAWALGKLGGDEALQALERRLAVEEDAGVREELNLALERTPA